MIILLRRWLRYFQTTPVIDAIAPNDVRPEWDAELRRYRGVGQILTTTRDEIARRRQLLSACESSPTRQAVRR